MMNHFRSSVMIDVIQLMEMKVQSGTFGIRTEIETLRLLLPPKKYVPHTRLPRAGQLDETKKQAPRDFEAQEQVWERRAGTSDE